MTALLLFVVGLWGLFILKRSDPTLQHILGLDIGPIAKKKHLAINRLVLASLATTTITYVVVFFTAAAAFAVVVKTTK